MKNLFIVSVLAACAWTAAVCSDEWKENEDESKVVSYPLPDPLLCQDGTPVTTPELWTEKRRGEILEMFRMQMYGMMPDYDKSKFRWETLRVNPVALNGKAVFKEIRIWFDAPNARPKVDILVCIPRSAAGPVPAGDHAAALSYFPSDHFMVSDEIDRNGTITTHRSWEIYNSGQAGF